MKHQTFDRIREKTFSSFQSQLKQLFDSNDVYPIGFQFYSMTTNFYLGDIKEIEEKKDQIRVIDLEINFGNTQSFISDDNITLINKYKLAIDIIKS